MQDLDFPVRILTKSEDDIVLMVEHEGVTDWYRKNEQKEKGDKTRAFCNWIRKQFPDVPTEFCYLKTDRVRDYRYRGWSARWKTINTDKHFVAYGLTRNQLLMIKLSFSYKTQKVELEGADKYETGSYIIPAKSAEPTEALKKRIAKNIKAKPVKL